MRATACADHAGFRTRAEAFHFGEVVLTAYRCSAQTFDRSRARIGRDGIEHYTLQLCLSGRHGHRDGASGREAQPGDLPVFGTRHDAAEFMLRAGDAPRRMTAFWEIGRVLRTTAMRARCGRIELRQQLDESIFRE